MKERRFIFMMLVFVFLFSMFSGCDKNDENDLNKNSSKVNQSNNKKDLNNEKENENENQEKAIEENEEMISEPISLKVYTSAHETLSGEAKDIWFWKYAEKNYNIKFDVTQIMASALAERRNLMFASDELPDILLNMGLSTNDIVKYGQYEKQLLDFNPYISVDNTPKLSKVFEKDPVSFAGSLCPDGGLYTLPYYLQANDEGAVFRIFINNEWLDEVNMEMPKDLDEFYNVLKAFKDNDLSGTGNTIPLGGGDAHGNPTSYILSAFGLINSANLKGSGLTSPAIKDGQVVIPAYSDYYIEYIKYMKKLYDEGLINEDYFTIDATQANAQFAERRVGVYADVPYLHLPEKEDYLKWEALIPATSNINDERVWKAPISFAPGTIAAASSTEYPNEVANLLDFFFDGKGAVYAWAGPVSDSKDTLGIISGWYFDENDKLIFKAVEEGLVNSGYEYVLGQVAPASGALGNRKDILNARRALDGLDPKERTFNEDSGEYYRKSVYDNCMPYTEPGYPIVYLTEEESIRLSDLGTVIGQFVETETAKFILSQNDIDNLDKYFSDLEKLGIKEYLGIYESAFVTYKENIDK